MSGKCSVSASSPTSHRAARSPAVPKHNIVSLSCFTGIVK
uniref:Uncharacterized protein n=1 Tax=Arundo donax TaxID=35708 RepID=A0A0A9FEY9_ARUDO